jgi:hypothetical protein
MGNKDTICLGHGEYNIGEIGKDREMTTVKRKQYDRRRGTRGYVKERTRMPGTRGGKREGEERDRG